MNKYEATAKVSMLNNTQLVVKKIKACDSAWDTTEGMWRLKSRKEWG